MQTPFKNKNNIKYNLLKSLKQKVLFQCITETKHNIIKSWIIYTTLHLIFLNFRYTLFLTQCYIVILTRCLINR